MKNIGLKIILKLALAAALLAPLCARAAWEVSFDESTSTLSAKNGGAELRGKLSFRAFAQNGDKWKIAASRDGVKDRLAIVDAGGDVQGYVVFPKKSDELQILFCHRTAQSYRGMMSLEARLSLGDKRDCFACRSTPKDGERVLNMALGGADSALNDSVFDAQNDLLVKMSAKNLSVKTAGAGEFAVKMSGEIGESAQARFGFGLERGYFKNSYVPYYKPLNRANVPKTPTGWMSWNTYFDKATAEDNLAEARVGKKYLQPFGCEIWSIESWQGNSDKLPVKKFHNMNLEVNERQFPEGMKKLAADIRALGFRPGLWVAPFGTGNAEFYKLHKDWFLHDKNGEPVRCWNGEYTLDPTVPEARKHLEGIFRKAAQDWGYEFFKIDGMSGRNKSYCAHLYERPEIRKLFKDPSCPNPFELCVKAFRDGIGSGSIFLACQGHTSGPEAAYAEMARTGADIVSPNKPVMWKNVLAQGRCTVNQLFAHNISMIADPDTLLVRDLDIEQARVSATIIALTGQLTFFGDKLAGLPPEKMKILQQTLPVELARPASLYPYFNMLPVWNLAVKHAELGDYNVVAFMNWDDEEKIISASAAELGISDAPRAAFEFWTQTPLGEMAKNFSVKVPARGARILVLMPKSPAPQFIGSDRHTAQAAHEISGVKWDAKTLALSARAKTVADFPLALWFSVPKGYKFVSARADGADCSALEKSGAVRAELKNGGAGGALLELRFSK